MLLTVILFVAGFIILLKGADLLIDGATVIAKSLRVSPFLIGLLIAGIGTSLPELAVTLTAHLTGGGDVGLGTVIGSNTFNILAILGLSAVFVPLSFKKQWVDRDLVWNFVSITAVGFFALIDGVISRFEGGVLILMFAWWLYQLVKDRDLPNVKEVKDLLPLRNAFGYSLLGVAGVLLGGQWVVDGAVVMAQSAGMSEALIGLTIVGIGTSLPELTVTIRAALRGKQALAIGNILGSNIFDFLAILGVAALLKPVAFDIALGPDLAVTAASALALFLVVKFSKNNTFGKREGLLFLVAYVCYLLFLIARI